MIEKQAGVEIVGEVHQKPAVTLPHLVKLAASGELFVLGRPLLPLPHLEKDLLRRNLQRARQGGHHLAQADFGLAGIDRFGRRVFLDVHPLLVKIDGHRVFGHVGIVEPVAGNPFAPSPATEVFQVLAQAVGKHLRPVAKRCASLRLIPFGGAVLDLDEPLRLQFEVEQFALQGPVEQRMHAARADAEALAQLGIAGEDGGPPAAELIFEPLAEPGIEGHQLFDLAQPLAVRGVGHHQARPQAFAAGRFEGGNLPFFKVDMGLQAGLFGIGPGGADRPVIGVVTDDDRQLLEAGGPALSSLFEQGLPEPRIMPLPTGKAVVRTLQPRSDIGRHQGRLEGQGPRAAHGIDQSAPGRGRFWPPGAQQNRRRQIFLERGQRPFLAVAAPVQALPGKIEAEGGLVAVHVEVDAHIRRGHLDRGANAPGRAELVDHRVLDLEGGKVRMGDLRAGEVAVHRQRSRGFQVLPPDHRLHPGIELFRGGGGKTGQRQQDSAGQP